MQISLSLSHRSLCHRSLSRTVHRSLSLSNPPTFEFQSVAKPIGRIQPSIFTAPGSYFFLANCKGIDADEHVANEILSSFDVRLRQYAMRQLTKN
ncbi:hypothetical protein Syun_001771 [Stephania yunnanensis]|uniref:Uncharacterized protein n=1 Tax=Stephania yunnanensis TaxID=152371 RepID=A0AAP0QB82_9MAGN